MTHSEYIEVQTKKITSELNRRSNEVVKYKKLLNELVPVISLYGENEIVFDTETGMFIVDSSLTNYLNKKRKLENTIERKEKQIVELNKNLNNLTLNLC